MINQLSNYHAESFVVTLDWPPLQYMQMKHLTFLPRTFAISVKFGEEKKEKNLSEEVRIAEFFFFLSLFQAYLI